VEILYLVVIKKAFLNQLFEKQQIS